MYDCDCDLKTSWGRCLRRSVLKLTAPYSSQISVRLAILVHRKTLKLANDLGICFVSRLLKYAQDSSKSTEIIEIIVFK